MNQEQNNLNPNNINTQGNNGIPNNQPLNNQGVVINQQAISPTPQPVNNSLESGNTNNQNLNSKPPKKVNIGLIIGIVAAVVVIIAVVVSIVFIPKIIKNSLDNVPSIDKIETNNNETASEDEAEIDEDYTAPWNDFTAYVQGVEFVFPMTFDEFQNKIAKTTYELNYHYSLNDKIYSSYSTSNYIKYTNEVREYNSRTGAQALQYDILVFLQNNAEEAQPVTNCNVIGFEVSNIKWASDNDKDLPYDEDVYFTKKKLHLGQDMTKKELIKKFGKPNGWSTTENIYSAGSIESAFYKFPKFQCNMDYNNKINHISLQNYIVDED